MEETARYVAKTLQGLEAPLAEELRALGAQGVEEGCRAVTFEGDKAMLYKANFFLRTALRILKPLYTFEAKDADELYAHALTFEWESVMNLSQRFAIDSVVNSEVFTHSKFAALRVKDAIVDQFRNRMGRRPFVDPVEPDVRIHLHIHDTQCSLLLDSSGESLHLRGYRKANDVAPLNEVLAAGMVLLSGWNGEVPFIDPMCGSGTLLIEAALIARGIAPGIFRRRFGFEAWDDFDRQLLEEISNDDSYERDSDALITGSDVSEKAVQAALANVAGASLKKAIHVQKLSVFEYHPPRIPGIVVTNPPYGERLKQFQIDSFYEQLGDCFKQGYDGWEVWMLTGNRVAMRSFGLHPSRTISLANGPIECKFQRFDMYKGSRKGMPPSDD